METFFNDLGITIDARWESKFDQLLTSSESSDSPSTKDRLTGLGASFDAFTSGLGEESLKGGGSLETVLTAPATPGEIQSLIVSHQQFETSVADFPAALGPRGAAAWERAGGQPARRRLRR